MINAQMNSSLLCCFLLAIFYHDTSSFTQLDEGLIFSTTDINYNFSRTDPPQQMNQSERTKLPNIGNGSSSIQCADEIQVEESSAAYNKENVNCIQDFINTCSKINAYLLYGTGSMSMKILGLIDGSCKIDVMHELERDSNSYTCMIPLSKLSTWESWKNGDGLDVFGVVSNLCLRK
jgi:hypothetical protein